MAAREPTFLAISAAAHSYKVIANREPTFLSTSTTTNSDKIMVSKIE